MDVPCGLSLTRLSPPRPARLLCTEISSTDDIVYTSLNPSPAYKTTILAGLDPTIINDICGRALSFWTYQITQEATFQNLVLKDAQEVRSTPKGSLIRMSCPV